MKQNIFLSLAVITAIGIGVAAAPAHALSCLPVDMYLKDVVGKDEVVIFVGTATHQMQADEYTAEVLSIEEVKQGYMENEVFVYHEKSKDWGYYCNQGPAKEGEKGLYIATRDDFGKYTVTQRLALTDPLIETLEADLDTAEVTGEVGEIAKTDRMNALMTTISDALKQIQILFKEYLYWKNN